MMPKALKNIAMKENSPLLQMGQHWSGSYFGSTHSVWGQAATVHNTSPLGSHRHFSHGDTWTTQNKSSQIYTFIRWQIQSSSRTPPPLLKHCIWPVRLSYNPEVKRYKCIRERERACHETRQWKWATVDTASAMPSNVFTRCLLLTGTLSLLFGYFVILQQANSTRRQQTHYKQHCDKLL